MCIKLALFTRLETIVAKDFEESCGLMERGLLSQHLREENEKYKQKYQFGPCPSRRLQQGTDIPTLLILHQVRLSL